MRTRIIALVLIAALYPLIGGQWGCAGGQLKEGEMPALEQAATQNIGAGVEKPMVGQALIPGETPVAGGPEIVRGPERVICGQPEIPGERLVPQCGNYLIEKADGIIIVDKDRFNFDAMKKLDEATGLNMSSRVKRGMDPAGIIRDRGELFDKLASVCAACNLRAGAEGQAPAAAVPGVAAMPAPKDQDFPQRVARWCKDFVAIYEFKGPPPSIREIIRDVVQDENGNYPANNGLFGWQSSDQKHIVIGTADWVKSTKAMFDTPRENAGREFAAFAPAGMLISESSALLSIGFRPIIDFSKLMALPFRMAAAEAGAMLRAGIDFADVATVGAGIYMIKDNVEQLSAKSVLTMSYEKLAEYVLREKQAQERGSLEYEEFVPIRDDQAPSRQETPMPSEQATPTPSEQAAPTPVEQTTAAVCGNSVLEEPSEECETDEHCVRKYGAGSRCRPDCKCIFPSPTQ